ncbi:hypothetical protein PSAC2689_20064 [Paraburkholderia sacchari]
MHLRDRRLLRSRDAARHGHGARPATGSRLALLRWLTAAAQPRYAVATNMAHSHAVWAVTLPVPGPPARRLRRPQEARIAGLLW